MIIRNKFNNNRIWLDVCSHKMCCLGHNKTKDIVKSLQSCCQNQAFYIWLLVGSEALRYKLAGFTIRAYYEYCYMMSKGFGGITECLVIASLTETTVIQRYGLYEHIQLCINFFMIAKELRCFRSSSLRFHLWMEWGIDNLDLFQLTINRYTT